MDDTIVHEAKGLSRRYFLQDFIYQMAVSSWPIGDSKSQSFLLECPERCRECRLLSIVWVDVDAIKSTCHVASAEDVAAS